MSYNFEMLDLFFLIIIIIILFVIVRFLLKKQSVGFVDKKEIQGKFLKIVELLNYKQEMNYKLAVIEADKLLDYVLQKMRFPGETMAKRLKIASLKYPKLKKVWWAHKVRNLLVHDVNYTLKYSVANKVVKTFKKALKELNAI